MPPPPSILVFGSINMDVVTPLQRLPRPGETIHAGDIMLAPGGKGANAAVAAARLGGKVRFAGSVGTDSFGLQLRANLEREGIDTRALRDSTKSSGTAVILLNQASGQNSIMVGPGANAEATAPADPAWYAGAGMLMLQLETPVEAALDAARHARSQGVPVMLDPAPALPELPRELLSAVDYLLPNETELATLSGQPTDSFEQIVQAARSLVQNYDVREIVVTLGAKGALWLNAETSLHVPSIPVKAVDTTAAGDTFAGALSVALASGHSMPEAIRYAVVGGALACTRRGAQPSIPYRVEVLEKMSASTR
ncbi:ribokinase [Ruficoccus amylovorans]|uniref:Ribokinase n=1 Tax=Ruficoccus amylovorans TaxID=1804625 RepID=A0A842HEF7_9BACT|nr:ribokinase [Ruficoccus amylovorans]MBC2593711.1 ribokinase [Ruficoccus amylovorans]